MTSTRRIVALLSALLLPLFAVSVVTTTASAADGSLFQPLSGFKPSASANVSVRPTAYRAYRADLAGIRAQLAGSGAKTLSIPDPAGTMTDFTVAEDSVMAPSLQAKYPDIRTYAGAASNGTTIRLDVTPLGFHAMVRRPDGIVWYVEPATRTVGENRVLSFAGAAAGDAPGLEDEVRGVAQQAARAVDGDFSTPGGEVTQRVYRLALVTDPAYAQAITGGVTDHATDDPIVFAAKATLVNRVNEVYNDDVAYRFEMIPGTDTKLNLLTAAEMSGPGGPCGADACYPAAVGTYDCGDVLNRNTFALGQLVGADTFDIGHIGMGVNGGGIAGLGVVGGASKARGCTGIPTPVGDVYAIDYVAHEMGHQMGGNHTFNGTQVNCSGGNRNGATSVEPGSGVTIMAYAGICGSDDLQPHSDPYFSFKSIDEFEATTAAAPANVAEQQVVNLAGYDGADAFTVSCASCTPSTAITNGTNYTTVDLVNAVAGATGKTPTSVTGYDGGAFNTNGFTVTWPSGAGNVPTLVITPTVGTFTTFTGVITNGGPGTNGGDQTLLTDEHSPVVTAPADKTIPKQTPFTLTGSATDADAGDVLTYQWEQTDNGVGAGTSLVSNTKRNGPLFRVFGEYADVTPGGTVTYHSPGENVAGTDPSRTFPDLVQILEGTTNAATGTCPAPAQPGTIPVTDPALNCFSEFLPTSDWVGTGNRVMHFRLTARDNYTHGGGTHPGGVSWANVALSVDQNAGPFLVTSQATNVTQSGPQLVTWSVNGTDAPTLAPNVKISLSTDGGHTFPTVLIASTPNDGKAPVLLPDLSTTTARIKVEAVGNYFFDINDQDFTIQPTAGNVAPLVDAGPDKTVQAGTAFASSGGFADEDPPTATATVDYGDGAGPQPLTLTGSSFALSHTYATAGTKTVTVKVTDSGSLSGTDTATVTVTAAPPTKQTSTTAAQAKPKKIVKGHTFKAKVTVTTSPGVATGDVQVYLGSKLLGTGTLKSNGKVTIKISKKKAKKLKVGKNTLTAKYLGSSTVLPSQTDFKIKVTKPKH